MTDSHAPSVVDDVIDRAAGGWRIVGRRFFQHRLAVAGLIVLIAVVLVSLIGGSLWTYSHDEITNEFSSGPSWEHPFGTDGPGHDTLAQVLRGAQKSVQVMLVVALLSTGLGVLVGAVAGYYRGWLDAVLMRFIDLLLTIPALAVLLVLARRVEASGSWFWTSVIIAGLVWTQIARVVRSEILRLREQEFTQAAVAMGATDRWIVARHLLPNAVGTIVVAATLTMAAAILIETTLSYLGLGIRPPDTSLGLLVADGQGAARTRPWLFYFPGLFIILIVLSVNFLGDGLRDAFDPHRRHRR